MDKAIVQLVNGREVTFTGDIVKGLYHYVQTGKKEKVQFIGTKTIVINLDTVAAIEFKGGE